MKRIENYETVQASSGEFARPTAGGYICKIMDVEDVPMNEQGKGDYLRIEDVPMNEQRKGDYLRIEDVPMNEQRKGDYLRIEYDIADGEFKGYYKEQFDRWGGNWNASFIRSYKEKALGMLKHFTNCIEQSNAGYEWDWNEKGLIGKFIGLVLGEEDYQNNAGEIKTKLVVKNIATVEDIKNGNFKVPAPKKLSVEISTNDVAAFTPIEDDSDLPF